MQVWDAATGTKQYTFEGHEAPVYSVCPHHKENIQVMFANPFILIMKQAKWDVLVLLFFPSFSLLEEEIRSYI
jgi:hypothetical protein